MLALPPQPARTMASSTDAAPIKCLDNIVRYPMKCEDAEILGKPGSEILRHMSGICRQFVLHPSIVAPIQYEHV
jgi:hypothetical protein